jgi:hypothetical protein
MRFDSQKAFRFRLALLQQDRPSQVPVEQQIPAPTVVLSIDHDEVVECSLALDCSDQPEAKPWARPPRAQRFMQPMATTASVIVHAVLRS